MSICLDDVAFWVAEWEVTGDIISEALARKIAEYWHGEDGVLAAFARGETVDGESFRDDIAATICYAKTAGFETIRELYALKDWAMCRG